jgi:hypothetical protein
VAQARKARSPRAAKARSPSKAEQSKAKRTHNGGTEHSQAEATPPVTEPDDTTPSFPPDAGGEMEEPGAADSPVAAEEATAAERPLLVIDEDDEGPPAASTEADAPATGEQGWVVEDDAPAGARLDSEGQGEQSEPPARERKRRWPFGKNKGGGR